MKEWIRRRRTRRPRRRRRARRRRRRRRRAIDSFVPCLTLRALLSNYKKSIPSENGLRLLCPEKVAAYLIVDTYSNWKLKVSFQNLCHFNILQDLQDTLQFTRALHFSISSSHFNFELTFQFQHQQQGVLGLWGCGVGLGSPTQLPHNPKTPCCWSWNLNVSSKIKPLVIIPNADPKNIIFSFNISSYFHSFFTKSSSFNSHSIYHLHSPFCTKRQSSEILCALNLSPSSTRPE